MSDPRDRDKVTEEQFTSAESRFDYLEHELHWIEVIGNFGRSRVAYSHKLSDPNLSKLPPRDGILTEDWVLYDGVWFRDLNRFNN